MRRAIKTRQLELDSMPSKLPRESHKIPSKECKAITWFGKYLQAFSSNTIAMETTGVPYYYNLCGVYWCRFPGVQFWLDHKDSGLEKSVTLMQWFKEKTRSMWKTLSCALLQRDFEQAMGKLWPEAMQLVRPVAHPFSFR